MKIINFYAENFKRLRVVRLTPEGHLVQLTGANGQGKSSVLDAIWAVLGGAKAAPDQPVRRGAKNAVVKIDLGDLIVTRRFTAEGASALQVEAQNGKVFSSPQRVIDEMMGRLTFDPLAFLRMDAKAQLETLRSVVSLDIDIDALDGANQRDYAARTEANREAAALQAQADAITVPENLPATTVDVAGLLERITQASTHNAEIEQRRARRDTVAGQIKLHRQAADDKLAEANRLRARAAEIEADGQKLVIEADALQAKLDTAEALPEPADVTELRRQYDQGMAVNDAIAKRDRKLQLTRQAASVQAESQRLTDAMEARKAERTAAIARAKLPVPGLSFGDGQVMLNDLPFDQASGAEQLRTSLAVAMAMNPKLRVARIKEGSLLDENGMKLVAEMAEAFDFQVWVESVRTDGAVGFTMEDGELAAINGQPATE